MESQANRRGNGETTGLYLKLIGILLLVLGAFWSADQARASHSIEKYLSWGLNNPSISHGDQSVSYGVYYGFTETTSVEIYDADWMHFNSTGAWSGYQSGGYAFWGGYNIVDSWDSGNNFYYTGWLCVPITSGSAFSIESDLRYEYNYWPYSERSFRFNDEYNDCWDSDSENLYIYDMWFIY